jgi:long-chain acyl-CoA synthetase
VSSGEATTGRLTLWDVLANHARARPDQLAIGDGEMRLTWSELAPRVERAAAALQHAGVREGERVLWLGQNSFRVQELLLACSRLGARFCPANWRQQPDELAFVIDDLSPVVIVTQDEEVGDTVRAGVAAAHHRAARTIVHDADGPDSYESFVAAAPAALDHQPLVVADDPLLLIYTAAFGGHPNAAMLPSRALMAQSLLMGQWMGITAEHRYLNAGPLFHIGVFMENLATFVFGGTNVFVRRNDGDALAHAIASFRCTSGYILGPMVDAIVDANAGNRYDLSSFRGKRGNATFDAWVQSSDTPWGRRAGGYGQTEVMGMATFNLLSSPDELGTHGRPSPLVQLRVVDPDDVEVATGETGEIAIKGVTAMNGYWNRPELNADRARGGWHHTNDLGRYEVDGTFSFVGPKTRMLKSGAENIYPAEVEAALKSHPDVADAAIIGVPDERWVQSVKAIVVRRDGAGVGADELIAHCRERIASYKKPRTVEFVTALPRKGFAVDYDALDAQFGGGNYPGGSTRSV